MILVRQHGESGPPALFGEWLDARGIDYVVSDIRTNHAPDVREFDAVASLGCRYSPADADVPQVRAEIELIARAVEDDVPVLGLCFGGQVLAHVLGGTNEAAPTPELGWHEIETDERGRDPGRPVAAVALPALHDPARGDRGRQHRERHAGLPPWAAPRPPVPPRIHDRDRACWAGSDKDARAQDRRRRRRPGAARGAGTARPRPRQAAFHLFDAF